MDGSRKKCKSIQRKTYRPAAESEQGSPFLTLVAEDAIQFRFLSARGGDPSPTDSQWIMRTFRSAFNEVWKRIPFVERRLMLDYWRHLEPARTGRPPLAQYPLIEIQEVYGHDPSRPSCEHCGHKLFFPTDVIVRQPATLTHEIACLLVRILRYANREFWRLFMEQVEQPFAEWEAGKGAQATEDARDRKYAELESNYLRAHHAAVARRLQSWSFEGTEREYNTE